MSDPSLLFDWRRLVASEYGPEMPRTRHVLLTLSLRMNRDGGSCYPAIRTLAADVGVGRSTVARHLKIAEEGGWIRRYRRGLEGQGWKRTGYHAVLPKGVPPERDTSADKVSRLDGTKVSRLDGTEDVNKNHISIEASQDGRRRRDAYPDSFQRAWAAYPRRAGGNPKKAAYRCWRARVRQGASEDELERGVARYAAYCEATGKTDTEYVKQASTFLGRDEHWREDWTVPSKATGAPQPALANLQALQ